MQHLTPEQLHRLEAALNEREATLQAEIRSANAEAEESAAASANDVGDAVDVGDDRYRAGMAHVDKQRDQEELILIEAARARMSEGSYGECVDCGLEIPAERLQAQPIASRCLVCQEQFEKSHPPAPLFAV